MIKPARPWAPDGSWEFMTGRSLDIYLTTEDLALKDNRVRVDGDRILIDWTPTSVAPRRELVDLHPADGIETNSDMCGTAVAGTDSAASVLDATCRSHDIDNLWLADSAFFPSSAALNPALTIAANALRIAPHIAAV